MIDVKDMKIFEKMAAIAKEVGVVAKNLSVETGKGKGYKAVSEGDVLAAVKPLEDKYGVYSYPISRRIVDSGTMVSTLRDGSEKKQLYLRIETTYRFVNLDNPEDTMEVMTYGDGVDSQDKAPGKAMTYADKYAILKAYKIMTGDDPDQYASEELKAAATHKSELQPERQPEPDMNELCSDTEILTIESMFTKAGHDPGLTFKNWPKVTKAEYGQFMQQLRERRK